MVVEGVATDSLMAGSVVGQESTITESDLR